MTSADEPLSCLRVRASLADLVEDPPPGARLAALEAHLAGCAACRAALARERRLLALLGELPRTPAPARFAGAVMARILPAPARAAQPRRSARVAGWLLMPVALIALVAIMDLRFNARLSGPAAVGDAAAQALVQWGRGVSGTLDWVEGARTRGRAFLAPARETVDIVVTAERVVRERVPAGILIAIVLVGFSPLVLLFAIYHLRMKGAAAHVLAYPIIR
jgi:anti-sigma factor RsiW